MCSQRPIDSAMTNTKISEARRIVISDGNIAGNIRHVIMNAVIPAQRCGRKYIGKAGHRVAEAP